MWPRAALLVSLAALLGLAVGPVAAEPVRIEVRSASGAPLGQLTGTLDGKVAYFALPEVARLVRGTVRTSADGARATLRLRGKAVDLRRNSPRVTADGRALVLSAPVRVRDGTWWVPGEALVKALPALLGSGVRVSAVPGAAPPPRGPRPLTTEGLPPPPAAEGRSASGAAARPRMAASHGAVELRHQTYPGHTRVVLEGTVPTEPRFVETDAGLVLPLAGLTGPMPQTVRAVRDGLIASLELTEAQGHAALRVAFERAPGTRKVFRLEDPPRLVLDFYRAPVPSGAPALALPVTPASLPPAAPPRRDVARVIPGEAAKTSLPAPDRGPAERTPAPLPSPASGPEPDPGEPAPTPPVKAGAVELRYRSYPTYTRVVLEGPTPFEPRLVESHGGLVVPLGGAPGAVSPTTRAVRDGLIAALELTRARGQASLRVTFERPPGARRVYRLQDPPRLVLDFYRAGAAPPAASGERPALQTIVIDPGHGGQDAGAVGPGGLREKELTLDISRRLAQLVQEDPGVKVVLTRSRDQFVALRERTAFANRQKADLFVSVHVNAAPEVTATGTETYFLSSEATDNAARAAAAFENKVIALEPGRRSGPRDVLRSILWDLAQSEFQQESSRLAEALQDSLERALRQPSRGVKQAPFYVLGGAAMPAVLVEIGFLSNPQEEQRLRDEGYRDRIARALAAGLAAYKRHYEQKRGVVVHR